MDEEQYDEMIINASEQLAEDLLELGVDDLIEQGRQLDSFAADVLREVARRMMRQLYATLEVVLEKQAKRQGMTVQRRPTVDFSTLFGPIEVESPYL